MSQATPDILSAWLLGGAAVMSLVFLGLGIAVHIRTLRTKEHKRPLLDRFAARKELEELRDEVRKLDAYTHESVHSIRDAQNANSLRIESLHLQLVKDMQAALLPLTVAVARISRTIDLISACPGVTGKKDNEDI